MRVLYGKPFRRCPVRVLPTLFPEDAQGAIPVAWCRGCGREVFEPGKCVCPACEKEDFCYGTKEEPL